MRNLTHLIHQMDLTPTRLEEMAVFLMDLTPTRLEEMAAFLKDLIPTRLEMKSKDLIPLGLEMKSKDLIPNRFLEDLVTFYLMLYQEKLIRLSVPAEGICRPFSLGTLEAFCSLQLLVQT